MPLPVCPLMRPSSACPDITRFLREKSAQKCGGCHAQPGFWEVKLMCLLDLLAPTRSHGPKSLHTMSTTPGTTALTEYMVVLSDVSSCS